MAKKKTKKKSRARYAFRRFCAVFIVIFLTWRFNNYSLKTTKTAVSSVDLTAPMRIAVVSDLHFHKLGISTKKVMSRLKKMEPDIVFVLGDMYSRGASPSEIDRAVSLMADIAAIYPEYFVPGDHDTSEAYHKSLSQAGVHVMNYKSDVIEIKGNRLKIMGIDNVYYSSTFDLSTEFDLAPDCYNILLAHIPNFGKFSQFGADLTLCADTHGGMVQLPFGLGAAFDPQSKTYFPELRGYTVYDKGWFAYGNGSMFITSGIGDSPFPMRFNNRPEVVSIDLIPQQR